MRKTFLIKSKFDEYESSEDVIRSIVEVSQNVSRALAGRPFRLFPIALPQFVDEKRYQLVEKYVKEAKLREL